MYIHNMILADWRLWLASLFRRSQHTGATIFRRRAAFRIPHSGERPQRKLVNDKNGGTKVFLKYKYIMQNTPTTHKYIFKNPTFSKIRISPKK